MVPTILPDDASNKEVTWKSNHPEIVEVDKEDYVTPKAIGDAEITVATKDSNKTASCAVSVVNNKVPASSFDLNKEHLSLFLNCSSNNRDVDPTMQH